MELAVMNRDIFKHEDTKQFFKHLPFYSQFLGETYVTVTDNPPHVCVLCVCQMLQYYLRCVKTNTLLTLFFSGLEIAMDPHP